MLTLNRKSDYALISLSHLGRCRGSITSAREIADTYQIPLPLLMNILKQLTREGIIASVRGAKGGYRLAVEPADLTVKQVLLAVEGPVRLVRCAEAFGDGSNGEPKSGEEPCVRMRVCPVRGPVLKLHAKLEQFLDQVTLAEIIDGPGKTVQPEVESPKDYINEPSVSG
jgi:Rrf2 family protein